jgi:hypothetical protein
MKANVALLLALVVSAFAPSSRAAEEFKGNWTIAPSAQSGQIQFGLIHRRNGGHSQSESDWPVSAFQGLDLSASAKHDVKFSITRDAGRLDCEGYLEGGEGAGLFRFTRDAQFPKAMSAIGFEGIDDDRQFAMAVHDVSLAFAKAIKAEKLSGLTTDTLLAFRIHGVTPQFIDELRTAGLPANDADRLIAFRIHGVTPKFVASVGQLGFKNLDADHLIAMRIHGVTPEYIANMKSRGLKDLTVDQLVNLRIHGID